MCSATVTIIPSRPRRWLIGYRAAARPIRSATSAGRDTATAWDSKRFDADRVRAVGHVSLRLDRDVLVAGGEQGVGGKRPPGRRGGGLLQGGESHRALGGCHQLRGGRVDIGGELAGELVLTDVELGSGGAVGQRILGGPGGRAEGRAGKLVGQFEGALADVGDERRDVDQGADIRLALCRNGDHAAAIGMPGQYAPIGHGVEDRGDIGGIGVQPAQRIGGGEHRMPLGGKAFHDAVPAGGIGEGAVDEDYGGHDEVALSRTPETKRFRTTR